MLLQRLRSPYLLPRCSKRRREPGGPAAAAPLLPTHRSTRDCERGRLAGLYRRAFPLAPADSRNRILALRAVSSAAFGPVSAGKREGALSPPREPAARCHAPLQPGKLEGLFCKAAKIGCTWECSWEGRGKKMKKALPLSSCGQGRGASAPWQCCAWARLVGAHAVTWATCAAVS